MRVFWCELFKFFFGWIVESMLGDVWCFDFFLDKLISFVVFLCFFFVIMLIFGILIGECVFEVVIEMQSLEFIQKQVLFMIWCFQLCIVGVLGQSLVVVQ